MVEVFADLVIADEELEFRASRSSGPGGQHVNKVESRVTLRLDLSAATSLSEAQKQRIRRQLPTRVTKDDVLLLHCQKHRSQAANRRELKLRLAELLQATLRRRKRRKQTRPSKAAKQRRMEQKRRRGELKRSRSKRFTDDG